MEYLHNWLVKLDLFIAGLIGAVIALPFQPELRTRGAKLVFIFSGAFCAHYLTALVAHYLHIDPGAAGSVGFLLGAFGGSLIAAVMRALNQSDLWALVRGRLGGRGE